MPQALVALMPQLEYNNITYMYTYIQTYIHACMHTYIHTYIYTYIFYTAVTP